MRAKRGFTLIELLVVIAIIAILAAILFPVFAKARERARQAGCISNQKQIVIAAKMFADDWEGVLPYVGTYTDTNGWFYGNSWEDHGNWSLGDGPIYDYVRAGQEVYKCPAIRNQDAPSYSWNRHLSHLAEAMVQFPTTCPLIWDGVAGRLSAPGIPLDQQDSSKEESFLFWPYGSADGPLGLATSRHAGGLILGFLDGHAKFERPTSGRFQPCKDGPSAPFPKDEDAGIKISMYPMDPMRNIAP